MNIRRSSLITAVLTVLAGVTVVANAAQPRYNPDHLGDAQFTRVAEICQNVMGLSPTERPRGGYWLDNSRLDYWTNHYRGCVLSLSDSLRHVNSTRVVQQAETAAVTPVSEKMPTAGPYFRASPHETARREHVACAALGLEATSGDFKSCVRGLRDTLYAIDHPIN
jgi:hypothetical protein